MIPGIPDRVAHTSDTHLTHKSLLRFHFKTSYQRQHVRSAVFCNQPCSDSGSRGISALLGNPQIIVSEDRRTNCLRAMTDALRQSVLAFGLELDTAAPWGWRRCSAIPEFGP